MWNNYDSATKLKASTTEHSYKISRTKHARYIWHQQEVGLMQKIRNSFREARTNIDTL